MTDPYEDWLSAEQEIARLKAEAEKMTRVTREAIDALSRVEKERDELLAPSEHEMWTKLGDAEAEVERLRAALLAAPDRHDMNIVTGKCVPGCAGCLRRAALKGGP